MNKTYIILLNGLLIGTTELEKADAPMGVVFGLIEFSGIESPYEFFKKYCLDKQIELASDYPEDKMISTMSISELKITSDNGIEIKGVGNQITGMDNEEYEIEIVPDEEVDTLMNATSKYKTKHEDGTDLCL